MSPLSFCLQRYAHGTVMEHDFGDVLIGQHMLMFRKTGMHYQLNFLNVFLFHVILIFMVLYIK
jgi:hypothetical protein